MAQFLILFRLVNSGIGSTVHDAVNIILAHERLNGLLVGDVQFCHVRIKIGMLGIHLLQQLHFISQLAITARNQYLHTTTIYFNDNYDN